ncbi:MAG: hypothetical protein V2A62_05285 [Candidatus Woesearchaeota archaeon]
MSLEIVIKEFNPVEFVYGEEWGKLILTRDADLSNIQQLFCYAAAGTDLTHSKTAEQFGIDTKLVMGGADTIRDEKEGRYYLKLWGLSASFGGIPAPVVNLMFPALESHLNGFDYVSAERKAQEVKYASQLKLWEHFNREVEGRNAQKRLEYEAQIEQAEALRRERMRSVVNRWGARWNKISVGDYVDDKYGKVTIPELSWEEFPAKPTFEFVPKLSAENVLIQRDHIAGPITSDREQVWIKFLGYDWRERRE